jgi:small-conductance mechanosensitive channel
MWQVLTLVLLAAITGLLWLSYQFASEFSLFASTAIPGVLHVAAAAATASLFIIAVGQLILRAGFAAYMQVEPTGLQRGLVLSLLTFAAVAAVLANFGLDLSTILTTSALVTALIGLSIQPTLSSLLSGLTIDRALKVGDGVLINGEAMEIASLNWRAVVGQMSDGRKLIIPNSKLADGTLEVLSRTQPTRIEATINVNAAIAPHQTSKIIGQILADMEEVDLTQPVVLTATEAGTSASIAPYRVTFWVLHFSQRDTAKGNFLRRVWYTFQRENLAEWANTADSKRHDVDALAAVRKALKSVGLSPGDSVGLETTAKNIAETGEMLSYGDGERIILPKRLAGLNCILVSGTLADALSPADSATPVPTSRLADTSRQAWIKRIERLLALRIGPYAEHATRAAASHRLPIAEVCASVAKEIDDPAEREAFVREVNPPAERTHPPGLLFRSRYDELDRLWSDPPLRAVDHAVIVTMPSNLLERDVQPGRKAVRAKVS